jgi:tetratricopeptide (TPR) repeat protein
MAGAGSSIKQALDAAQTAAKSGDVGRAVAIYRQILTKVPKHSKAKKALARLEKQGGSGAGQMTQADANALIQILNTGNFEAAQGAAKQLSQRFPNEPFVFNILGYTSGMIGDQKTAIDAYKWAIKLNPNFVEALSNYGSYLVQMGKPKDAITSLRKAIAKKPDYAEAHHNLGLALSGDGDIDGAFAHLDKAIQLNPNYANAFNSRGNLYRTTGQLAKALADLKSALKLSPNDAAAKETLSSILADLGDVEGSLALTVDLLKGDPTNLDLLRRKAVQVNALGRSEEAITAFRDIVKLRKQDGEAIGTLLKMLPAKERGPLRDEAITLLADGSLDKFDRVRLAFALASDAEREKDTANAGRWLNLGNTTYKSSLPPLPVSDETRFEQARAFFADGIPDQLRDAGNPSKRPIFVVGLMRSGTSLVEQIIASHSEVFGAGELNAVTDLGSDVMSLGSSVDATKVLAFAEDYLAILDAADASSARAVDKMPANFFFVGLLRLAFPNAAIINTVRDPRDTCFSIWKNFFDTHAHQYAYHQKELADFANNYRELMRFWDTVFPNEIYHVRYEDLVADQEAESRKLLNHLGLPWEDGVLDFHKTKRAVRTASVNQVREKIYTSSLKSWEPYSDHLSDLLDGFDPDLWADAFVD